MVKISLDPVTNSDLDIRLFRAVKNVPKLRKKVMAGQMQCCFVNPKLILDPFQLVVAANKAVTTEIRTTKTIFTEILFNLSVSKNISKSLQQFGINDSCTDLLVLAFPQDNNVNKIYDEIHGDEAGLGQLAEIQDLSVIKSAYKIGANEEKQSTLLDSIVSRIATKDFISY